MCNQSLTLNTLYVKTLAIALWSTKTKFLINTKQTNMKKLLSILVVLVAALVWNNVSAQIIIPAGNITTNTTWTNNNVYILDGFVYVKSGTTLTIQPGTIIKGAKTPDGSALGFRAGTLIIEPGAKLIANGTATQPIVFTSQQPAGINPNTNLPYRQPGDWGGVVICGYAPVNIPGGIGTTEGGIGVQYGWGLATNPFGVLNANSTTDSSGVLRYVRVEFPGIPLTTQSNSEINGITFYGVGNKTVLEHLQVSFSGDDAFEWFGGSVNAKYLIALGTWDDDFDTDLGFSGKVQFAVSQRYSQIADQSGSNAFESDNDNLNSPQGSTNTPFTQPLFTNVSNFGPYPTTSATANALHQSAMHLRRNTKTSIYNSFFAGYEEGLRLDGTGTQTNYTNDELQLENITIAGWALPNDSLKGANSSSAATILGVFTTPAKNNQFFANNAALNLNAKSFNVVDFATGNLDRPDFRPQPNSSLLTSGSFSNSRLQDPFFTPVNYRGAFGNEDWTLCWSMFNPFAPAYSAAINNEVGVSIAATGATVFCEGGSVGVNSTVTGNNSGIAYAWSNGSTAANITANATGNYNVTVTNAIGCSATAQAVSVTVNQNPTAPTITANGSTSFCTGSSVDLTSSYATGNLWSTGATTQTITVSTSETITVTHTDGNTCSATSAAITTSSSASPQPTVSVTGSLTFCTGGSVELTASLSDSYTWSNGATTRSIVVTDEGSYIVTVTNADACNGTGASNATVVTVNTKPTAAATQTANGLEVSFTNTSTNATNYIWDFGDGNASLQASPTYTYDAPGNYTVKLIAENANCADTTEITLSITVGIEEKDAFNSIKLYPNPTANYATLSMDLINNSDVHVLVFDLAGKLVHDIKNERLFAGEHQVKIDMTGLNNGLYLVTIKADKAVVSKRLVVNK